MAKKFRSTLSRESVGGVLVNARARNRSNRPRQKEAARARTLLAVLIAIAILLILLRLAEFAGHRVRNVRHGVGVGLSSQPGAWIHPTRPAKA
jgi:hypothetical protein